MDATATIKEAAGMTILKVANKQPELALELLTKTVDALAAGQQLATPAAEVPATDQQGTIIDIQV
jgi:hypothetical protein